MTHVPGLPSAKVPRKNALEVAASEYAVSESSQIYLEALDCHEAAGACAMRDYASPKVEADASGERPLSAASRTLNVAIIHCYLTPSAPNMRQVVTSR